MILLDTHIWIWWMTNNARLSSKSKTFIESQLSTGVGISVISCWEVAKLIQLGRLAFSVSTTEWIDNALMYPGVKLLDFTPQIAIEANSLPGTFHRDPADQIIVATARVYDIKLLTVDAKILKYPDVKLVSL
ncbi:MAG: type II toxin-antitoxin system VapC family toxin [Chloroflexota bacterium]